MTRQKAGHDWRRHVGGDQYKVTHDIHWEIGKKGSSLWVTVPAGFQFESSVPRMFRWLVSQHDPELLFAAALHDWLLEGHYGAIFSAGEWYSATLKYEASTWKALPICLAICAYTAIRRWGRP